MQKRLNIKSGDTVMIMTGDKDTNRGKTGKVLAVSPKEGKVIVEGLNLVSKHVKPKKAGEKGGIIQAESAIYACKVQIYCEKCKKPTRVGKNIDDKGKKTRKCVKCQASLD